MMNHLRPALVFTFLMTLLTGLIYPFFITGLAQVLFPYQANGSLIEDHGKIIGSHLIGQSFVDAGYFHGRPSATTMTDPNDSTKTVPAPYNAANSGGSNLGPTSQALIDAIKAAAVPYATPGNTPIPVDLVTASGSGLDPDITPAAAFFQISRVAAARGIPPEDLSDLINKNITRRTFSFFGEPTVNVLELNLALDRMIGKKLVK